MWTSFMDMHSGGGMKEKPYHHIFIEAPINEAKIIFYNRFGHNPERVSCTCCGDDYSIHESSTLEQATGYERHCRHLATPKDPETGRYMNDLHKTDPYFRDHHYLEDGEEPKPPYKVSDSKFMGGPYIPLGEYMKGDSVLIIIKEDIKPEERSGDVPDQGYMWVD